MRVVANDENGVTLMLTPSETLIVNNALNEIANGVDLDGEFVTRIGATRDEVRELLAEIHRLRT
jgi:hypothetical protein